MLLVFLLYPSAATHFPPLLPGNLHLIKFESVQAKQRKKSTVDLTKIKKREAVFSHIHWMWMCVCHKLACCANDAELPIWQISDWDTRGEMIFFIPELILFGLFGVSSYPASFQETTQLEIQWGFQVQWKMVNDQTFWSQEMHVSLSFGAQV